MTGTPVSGNDGVTESARRRLDELEREHEVGQRRLQELVAQEVATRETLLRISGAIQVLRELVGVPSAVGGPDGADGADGADDADGAADPGGREPATDPAADRPAPGTVLRVE